MKMSYIFKNYENSYSILFYIANSYYFINNLNGSLQYLDKSIAINQQHAGAWGNKGITLYKLGKYEEALATSDKAIGINPQYADAWYNKGLTLSKLGRYEDAKIAFENAHKTDPKLEVPSMPANSTHTS